MAVISWPVEALCHSVASTLPEFRVEVISKIDSTNSELMRRARQGQLGPVLLLAESQYAGRGRFDRVWKSEQHSLAFSLGLPFSPTQWTGMSLAVGVSLTQSLHHQLQLKWPNDIYLQGRKLGGILIEIASVGGMHYVVIGVGLNIEAPEAGGFSTAPAWLKEVLPDIDAPSALGLVIPPLVGALNVFQKQGFSPFQNAFLSRDALEGASIQLSDGSIGVADGVDLFGALKVQTSQGAIKVSSDEVSLLFGTAKN